jgi:hypothetical protein
MLNEMVIMQKQSDPLISVYCAVVRFPPTSDNRAITFTPPALIHEINKSFKSSEPMDSLVR